METSATWGTPHWSLPHDPQGRTPQMSQTFRGLTQEHPWWQPSLQSSLSTFVIKQRGLKTPNKQITPSSRWVPFTKSQALWNSKILYSYLKSPSRHGFKRNHWNDTQDIEFKKKCYKHSQRVSSILVEQKYLKELQVGTNKIIQHK